MLTQEQFWQSICTLDGRELKTLDRGRPFDVVAVREWQVVLSPAVSGKRRAIRRGTLEGAFGALLDRRELTSLQIADEFSAFNAVYVAVCTKPIRLIFVGRQLFYLE